MANIFLVFADTTGNVQAYNVGHSDYGIPIYYELETQELEFDSRAYNKTISDKIGIISNDASDSKIELIPDDRDSIPINIDLGNRVSVATLPTIKAHYLTFRWSGSTTKKQPVLEGLYFNNIKEDQIG